MKSIEFIKKYGWFGANEYLAGATFFNDNLFVFTNVEELQSLVNSYELVESYGGLKSAIYIRNHNMVLPEFMNKLKQAIELVESVNVFQPSVNPNQNIPEPPPPPIRLIKGDKLIK